MLGYFKPITKLLSKEDNVLYKSFYCTLCHSLKNRYGHSNTLFLQQDLIFILICSLSHSDKEPAMNDKKLGCVAFPLKRVNTMNNLENNIDALADMSIFTSYTAYLNSVVDGKSLSIKKRAFQYLFNKSFEKSANNLDKDNKQIAELKRLLSSEHQIDGVPDMIIEPICNYYAELIIQKLNLKMEFKELAFHVCRIMYYLDAIEDFESDRKAGHFNILNELYQSPQQLASFVQIKVFDSIKQIRARVPVENKFLSIIDNVLSVSLISQLNVIKHKFVG